MFHEGQQIGPYHLVRRLGRGGFGDVWLAEKRTQFLTKRVAVKLPHDDQVDFDTIQREAGLWEEASGHPNVLPIIDAEVYDGQVVIVSEYADGGSLHDKLNAVGSISTKEAVELTMGILSGLEFLHSKRIIHRDIKPQNILLQGGTPRLADFGISRAMATSGVSSTVIGTDAYMSPEAFDGKRTVETDVWSTGVVLYQLLSGTLPFPQTHPTERMFAVLTKEFEPLLPEVPSDLKKIVATALAKLPENRFRSAHAMREALSCTRLQAESPTLAKTEVIDRSAIPMQAHETADQPPTVTRLDIPLEQETVVGNYASGPPASTQIAFPTNTAETQTETKMVGVDVENTNFAAPKIKSDENAYPLTTILAVSGAIVALFIVLLVIIGNINSSSTASNSLPSNVASNRSANVTNTAGAATNRSGTNASNLPANAVANATVGSTTTNSNSLPKVVPSGATFCEGFVFGWRETFTSKGLSVPPTPTCPDPLKYRESMRDGYGGQIVGTMDAMGRINSSNSNK